MLNRLEIEPVIGCAYGAGEEIKANACLIAAAPELLETLKKAQKYVGMVRSSDIADDDPIFEVMGDIDAAIKKAEGKS